MDNEIQYQDQFQSLRDGEYRLFNPGMFKDLRNSTQADPQQGDTYENYQIEQDCNCVTKDDIIKSKNESIIDRFNYQDNPSNQQNQELKKSFSRVKAYSKVQKSKVEIRYVSEQLVDQAQSRITQRNNAIYAEPDGIIRKCSNPKFMPSPLAQQKEQLIRSLQLNSLQRQKYSESPYFLKKDRKIEQNQIQQIFHKYKTLSTRNYQEEKVEEPLKLSHLYRTEIKNPQKACKFCDVSKIKLHRQQTELEARANKANCSPARSLHEKYIQKEDKVQIVGFQRHLQPREQYLEEGRLKTEFLKSISHSIERQLRKLKQSNIGTIQSNLNQGTPRKKIFVQHNLPSRQEYIKIQDKLLKPKQYKTFTPQIQKIFISKKTQVYRNIFTSAYNKKLAETNKKNQKSNSVDFGYISTSLVGSRIKIFSNLNSKMRNTEVKPQKAKSPVRSLSPLKEKIAVIFIHMDMNTSVRKWFDENKLSIGVQTEKILSYQLIKRYLSKQQIEQKLRQLVQGMVKPKKWLLTLVDLVYSRLKDRYFPN